MSLLASAESRSLLTSESSSESLARITLIINHFEEPSLADFPIESESGAVMQYPSLLLGNYPYYRWNLSASAVAQPASDVAIIKYLLSSCEMWFLTLHLTQNRFVLEALILSSCWITGINVSFYISHSNLIVSTNHSQKREAEVNFISWSCAWYGGNL